jgi:hypothetical protein
LAFIKENNNGFFPDREMASAIACSRAPFPTSSIFGIADLLLRILFQHGCLNNGKACSSQMEGAGFFAHENKGLDCFQQSNNNKKGIHLHRLLNILNICEVTI